MTPALNPTLARLLGVCGLDRRWARGAGVWLFDETGRFFLDAYAQYGAVALGHNPPAGVAALEAALARGEPAMVQPYRTAETEALAAELVALAPGDLSHCLFTTSGAASVEAALKLVRAGTGRPLIVTARGGYHGKTLGTLALHPDSRHAEDFGPFDPGGRQVPWGDADAIEQVLTTEGEQVAGVLLEPILGEGGVHLPPPGYLRAVRRLCDEHGVALILDEVQTGLGRTGTLFACDAEGVVPDVLTLAKALSGGLTPLGAVLASPRFWSSRFALSHSSTFANNSLACAVGRAVLRELDARDLVAGAATKGAWLLEQLEGLARRHPRLIKAVRGRGLLTAIELRHPPAGTSDLLSFLEHHGVYAYAIAGVLARCASLLVLPTLGPTPVLRIAPPLTITQAELELVVRGLKGVFDALEREGVRLIVGALGDPKPAQAERVALPRPRTAAPLDYVFVAHLTRAEDLLLGNPRLDLDADELSQFVDFVAELPPLLSCRAPTLRSPDGVELNGAVVLLPHLPEGLLRLGPRAVCAQVQAAVDLGVSLGARVVGLGGHTTPLSRHGLAAVGRGARITTGNALTASTALTAVEHRLAARGTSLAELATPVAVLGGGGSVGALCARLAIRGGARRLLLVGNPASGLGRLERLRERLRAQDASLEIEVCNDLDRLAEAELVLSATASRGGVLGSAPLRPGALVCDLARPPDSSPALRARTDLEVIAGGLVHLPDPDACFGAGNLVGLPPGIQLACLAETVLLAFEERAGRRGPDHVGRDLPLETVDAVAALAQRYGVSTVLGGPRPLPTHTHALVS